MSDVILGTSKFTKEFKGFTAIGGLDLRVERGHIRALNGAVKTTCFNLLTKFLASTSGQILFNGRDITAAWPAQVARMGITRPFQISAVLTVRDNIRIDLLRRLSFLAQQPRSGQLERTRAGTAVGGRHGELYRCADGRPALRPSTGGDLDNEPRAVLLGYEVDRYKLLAFVLSAALAGLAGATKTVVLGFASLTDVHWTMSGLVVLMTLVGGMGTMAGSALGACIVVALENKLGDLGAWLAERYGVAWFGTLASRSAW